MLGTERKPRKSWVVWEEEGKYPNITIEKDQGATKQIYQDLFRIPDYFWFDPETLEFAGFHWVDGEYQPLEPNEEVAELERYHKEVERERADRLAAKLRELNIAPDTV